MNKSLIALCSLFAFNASAWDAPPENLDMNFTISSSVDDMSGETSWHAQSDASRPPLMRFPYDDVTSRIILACNDKDKELYSYFWFSMAPNIANDKTKDGYSSSSSRIKFDDRLDTISLSQKWGEPFMHVTYDNFLIKNIKNTKTVKLELNWHRNGSVIFNYNTYKAEIAIAEISKHCGIK